MNNVTENTKVIYVGIDVHKDTNSFCAYDSREDKLFAEHKSSSKFENTLHYLKNLQKSVGQDAVFLVGYEAGPTGYGLCRKLQKEGFACVIIAPSTIAKAPGQKVKTDRMDARLLAKTLAFKTYSPVCLPSEKLEAIKEYTRVRTAKITMLKKAKQNLLSFLLRNIIDNLLVHLPRFLRRHDRRKGDAQRLRIRFLHSRLCILRLGEVDIALRTGTGCAEQGNHDQHHQ